MPPKRGRGRGRGEPPSRDTQPQYSREAREERSLPSRGRGVPPHMQAPPAFSQSPMQRPVREPHREQPIQEVREVRPKPRVVQPEELGLELKYKLALDTPLPRRPSEGKLGRKIRLISNCYSINIPSGYVYHYDVEINSKKRDVRSEAEREGGAASAPVVPVSKDKKYRCLSTKLNREVMKLMLQTNVNFRGMFPAYDGRKNLYTRHELKCRSFPLKCEVQLIDEETINPDDPRPPRADIFEVLVKPVKKRDTDSCAINLDSLHALFEGRVTTVPQEAVMAVETIFRHSPCMKYVPVGRSFFYPPPPQDLHPLGGGREIWFGYHQSLRLGQWKPMVNLDITATTFYEKGPVVKFIAAILNTTVENLRQKTHLTDMEIRRLTSELKNMRIETNHLQRYRRKYRIIRLTRDSARRLEFTLTVNGTERRMTVSDYFKMQYNIVLQFPQLPCLQVNPEAKRVYLPIEVCDIIEGQHCKKKLEERQNAEMIRFTARKPQDRFHEIENIVRRSDYGRDAYLKEFGIKVDPRPLSLEGRVIESPSVRYLHEQIIKPRDGSWDMRDKQFFRPAEVESWALISFANERFCGRQALNKFAGLLCNIAKETGIEINRPAVIDIIDFRRVKVSNVLSSMKQKYKVDLVVVVVPGNNKSVYGEVKQAAETMLGLTTQCIRDESVVKKCNPPLVSNLCQKLMLKWGGVNNTLMPGEKPAILSRPVIIIGADVTHPSPSQDIKPSIAAAVGSLDAHPSRYAVSTRAQTNIDENKQAIEIILDLTTMVIDLLKAFFRHTNGKKPEKIIFYRDGVSEGQFEKVKEHEVRCIREACKRLNEDYEPGITFIVVQKRHHTRFMPQDNREGVGKMKNIPPGTTVDNTVTHPLNFDFFLCSHFGLQGTSRPSHYTVIEDDNDMTADDLQKLTFYLCHTFARCTKSISTPAPVQYAHLAAFRARQHMISQIEESTTSSDSSISAFHPLPDAVLDAIKVVDVMKSTMYFV
ncbi:LOW QUALITY PROTEIN: protein argonaute-4-like [Uloborus diversus]|uniref:LOW QUALITY PROTEIN: protein argonaute-4-like n=1 Tax=Uloborus diversus TaxID=327109 RepID=UPI002409D6B3|nr:LOW QUALITY PROTEIN: protein argonaute-4-like [Uloborus diversus]